MQPLSDVPATAWWLTSIVAALDGSYAGAIGSGLCASLAIVVRPNLVDPRAAGRRLRDLARRTGRTVTTRRGSRCLRRAPAARRCADSGGQQRVFTDRRSHPDTVCPRNSSSGRTSSRTWRAIRRGSSRRIHRSSSSGSRRQSSLVWPAASPAMSAADCSATRYSARFSSATLFAAYVSYIPFRPLDLPAVHAARHPDSAHTRRGDGEQRGAGDFATGRPTRA